MSDLAAFLLARIAEDEAAARVAVADSGLIDAAKRADTAAQGRAADCAHIARHDPARVLAECAAKRRIVEDHRSFDANDWPHNRPRLICTRCYDGDNVFGDEAMYPCLTLRALAQPYADHPDFAEEWRDERS